jgi:GNAT superfamily N-acetyltransferase
VLAGIGGVTVDPVIPEALRMRRFYIRERFRRHGIGQQLALALLAQPVGRDGPVTVNAAAGSAPFWEALGFIRDAPDTPICFPLSRINKIVALIIFNC